MPGGRLTQQERQQIALGLGDGLAYAEIARRLERPTSTITREVMRNGGPMRLPRRPRPPRHRTAHPPPQAGRAPGGRGVPAAPRA